MILVVDNYDSFTYNLVQALGQWDEVVVKKNDQILPYEIYQLRPSHVVISPGPSTPENSGVSPEVIRTFFRDIPILGVCLGFQAIATVFGGALTKTGEIYHGKTSDVLHDGKGIFLNIASPFTAMRYHSWMVDASSLPKELHVTAHTPDGVPMALQHESLPVYGVQFHPESILTDEGNDILKNFINEI